MKIGVFVGSFDPIHLGHVNLIKYLNEQQIVDKVFVIPTGNYWDKQNITDLQIRMEMLRFIQNDKIIILEQYNGYQYTYEIIEQLEKEYPNDEFYLVIGADNANTFDKWKRYQELLKKNIIVASRNNERVNLVGEHVIFLNHNFGNISSREIRENPAKSSHILLPEVYEYIIKNRLYDI